MSKKSKANKSLGRTLIKDRFGHQNRRRVDNDSMLHTVEVRDGYEWGRLNLNSVTEESSFQEFLRTAELAGTEFQAEKLNIKFIDPKQGVGLLTELERQQIEQKQAENKDLLKIPRRPKWTKEMSAHDLQQTEKEAFLDWRRKLALAQEDEQLLLTPYEKNLEFWRQLWRVVERSDVIVQIVDARNPLIYRSEDLEKYVHEIDENKMNVILINKSDLLTMKQREYWAVYFDEQNIRTAFFSATLSANEDQQNSSSSNNKQCDPTEIEKAKNSEFSDLYQEPSEEDSMKSNAKSPENNVAQSFETSGTCIKNIDKDDHDIHSLENLSIEDLNPPIINDSDKENKSVPKEKNHEQIKNGEIQNIEEQLDNKNSPKLLSRCELIEFFRKLYKGPTYKTGITTIGLVGYPNVGKSSTINTLMTQKKVSVSATPGKTKHFQTLFLEKDLMLCDCPGLVMPSFMLTKADMILNGILPIDQMRDHVPPINLLCTRIPRHILEDKYGIIIAKPNEYDDPNRCPHSEELLLAYGYNRGFMTANGQPDQSRAARYILKDYVNGRLLYCVAPPTVEQSIFQQYSARIRKEIAEEELPEQRLRALRINKPTTSKELDQQFFQKNLSAAHVKGRTNFPHVRINQNGDTSKELLSVAKPWRAFKKEKREKLRKKFSHLDQH